MLLARQLVLVLGAVLAYFGVRGLTEGSEPIARTNATRLLDLERSLGLDLERAIQTPLLDHGWLLDLANWAYIWLHWPLLVATLVWFVLARREAYFELRNAMFFSGAIGLVIFAAFPVAPPRLYSAAYVDTVTLHSLSYRVLQPPALVNAYAAMPSLHVGWNLLAGVMWWRVLRDSPARWAGVVMPAVMAWATISTGNHWVLDAVGGSAVALTGLGLERLRRRVDGVTRSKRVDDLPVTDGSEVGVVRADGLEPLGGLERDVGVGGTPEVGSPTRRRDGDGEHDSRGSPSASDVARRPGGGPCRDAVVDDDDHAPFEGT